jgi:hypothetical protein
MKKFVPDLPGVVEAEKAFIGIVDEAAPQAFVELARQLAALAQARAEGGVDQLRALSRNRWVAIMAVRAHGPSGDSAVDAAFGRMEEAASAAGEAKRRR